MIQNLIFGILFLKVLFQAYSSFVFIYTFRWALSEFFFNFKFSSRKLSRKTKKTSEKDHLFYNTALLEKPHSFYKAQLA